MGEVAGIITAIGTLFTALMAAYLSWKSAKQARELAALAATTKTILTDVNNNTTAAVKKLDEQTAKIEELKLHAAEKDKAQAISDLKVTHALATPVPGSTRPASDMAVENMNVENFSNGGGKKATAPKPAPHSKKKKP